jgi:hypothetical protein
LRLGALRLLCRSVCPEGREGRLDGPQPLSHGKVDVVVQDRPQLLQVLQLHHARRFHRLHPEVDLAILGTHFSPVYPQYDCVAFGRQGEVARLELRRGRVLRVGVRVEFVHVVDNEGAVAGSLDGGIDLVFAGRRSLPLRSEEWKVRVAVLDYIEPANRVSRELGSVSRP